MSETGHETDNPLREEAIAVLKKRREFHKHVAIYLLVNAALVAIWMVTNPGGFFWPVFPLVFWGIGVVMNAWDAYANDVVSEARIQREMEHLQHRR
jgi:hypothetical protein